MIKHVGKHNNRKVVILYRTVPGEDHMCLVTYSDSLPQSFHDEVMKVLESPVGQTAKEFSDALFRSLLSDGRNILHSLHQEGLIKKVPANQVIVTPTTTSNVRLDELNAILQKMDEGQEAVKKMRELDDQLGVKDPLKAKKTNDATAAAGVLSDTDLAQQRRDQATKMRQDAERLLAEAQSLEEEASALDSPSNVQPKKTKKKDQVH